MVCYEIYTMYLVMDWVPPKNSFNDAVEKWVFKEISTRFSSFSAK